VTDGQKPPALPRRQFVKLSGALGAAAVLAGCGSATTKVPASAPNLAESTQSNPLCGNASDSTPDVELWTKAQACEVAYQQGKTIPGCMGTTKDDVVLNGDPQNNHNFLLVPTHRIKGIECPTLWTTNAAEYYAHYWRDAWRQAQPGQAGAVTGTVGLGINSKNDRQQNQLHIHMARILSEVQGQLDSQGITSDPKRWPNSIVTVDGLVKGKRIPVTTGRCGSRSKPWILTISSYSSEITYRQHVPICQRK
jgi:CDP-diacylglycerol pyrophosphatase